MSLLPFRCKVMADTEAAAATKPEEETPSNKEESPEGEYLGFRSDHLTTSYVCVLCVCMFYCIDIIP